MQSGSVITLAVHSGRGWSGDEFGDPDATGPRASTGFDLSAEYDAHGRVLFGYAINALRDRGLAEDCVQETFLRAWRSRHTFDGGRASIRTWLFAIERNVIIDLRRTQQRLPQLVEPEALAETPAVASEPLDRLQVIEGLAKLSDEHRMVVVAVHLNGQSYSELSLSTGVPVATLRTRSFYALRALREHLDDDSAPAVASAVAPTVASAVASASTRVARKER